MTVQRGATVRLAGAPEWKQPFTVDVIYHSGALRLSSAQGAPKVSVDPENVTEVPR